MNYPVTKAKVTNGGRIVIPAKIREELNIKIGENVMLKIEDNELRVTTSQEALRRLQKLVRQHVSPDRSIVDEFLAERREEAKKDD